MLYENDCLKILKDIPDESVDMIYLDPPFFSQRKQSLKNKDGKQYVFSDVWDSRKDYLEYMKTRITEMRRVLKSSGSIFLHCDTSASQYLRIILDGVFGEKNFRSEIIWTYKRWSNSHKGLLPAHQTIFFYSKGPNYKFNVLMGEYSPTTNVDQILQDRERNADGKAVYKRDKEGNIVTSAEKKGVPLSDVWEIPFLNPKAKERTGYPTQKPIELLDRIIKISTDEGDMILDPFCGSGTALVSATLLNRQYIGIDNNHDAIELCRERLQSPQKTESHLLKVGSAAYKTKSEYELSILRQFDCDVVQRNKGIDGFLKEFYDGHPVAIRIQKNGETFSEALRLLLNAGKKKKCSYMILITDDAYENNKIMLPHNVIVLNTRSSQFKKIISIPPKSI